MTARLGITILCALIVVSEQAWSRPVDLSAPTGGVGAAGLYGKLELWQEVAGAGVQLDPESYLPFRYKFSSDNSTKGILGPGFYVPMFEARNVLIRERMMRTFLPCGKVLYMRRDNADPNKFATLDEAWTGYLINDGDDFVIWRDDGWKLLYHKNRLTSLTSDDNHVFTWSYDGSGLPVGLSKDGQTLVTVEPNAAGQVAAFIFSGKRYEVTFAERPVTQMLLGQIAIKELDQALASLKYPDGKTETFHFELTSDRIPTITFTNKATQKTFYTWDPSTGDISTEAGPKGKWTYKVGDIITDFGVPPISRTNSDGKTEGMTLDTKMGTYTELGADGVQTITHVFETPGPLYNKVQKIEKTSGKTTTLVYRASYDEAGKLIRTVDKNGIITSYLYNDQGQIKGQKLSLSEDPQFRAALDAKETDLTHLLTSAKSAFETDSALDHLAMFYISEKRDPNKALALVPQIAQRQIRYNIELMSANHDDSLNYVQKIDKYKSLQKEFPEHKQDLDSLIQQSQLMVNAGL